MSIAHTDALLTLVQSQTLVPSIIIFLTDLSNAFWEESDDLLESPELVAKCVTLQQGFLQSNKVSQTRGTYMFYDVNFAFHIVWSICDEICCL